MSVHDFNGRVIESVFYRRLAPFLLVLALVIAIVAAVGTYANNQAITRANTSRITDNEANSRVGCENGNEARSASRTLWYFVVDLTARGAAPAEAAYLAEVRSWIGDVYRPRDCNDLSRKYPIPPPPRIPAGLAS